MQKIKKINYIKLRIKELSTKIIEKDKEIFNNNLINIITEDVIKEDIKVPKKGKRGRPKKVNI